MRDSDLAVVPPARSLAFVLDVVNVESSSLTSTQDFMEESPPPTAQDQDLFVGTDGNFSVGDNGDFTRPTADRVITNVDTAFDENNFALNGDLRGPQNSTLDAVSMIPIGGISSPMVDEQNDALILSDDLDQFLALPSFLGQF